MSITIPALCFGQAYQSLNRHPVVDLGTGESVASLGLVRGSRIGSDCQRKDLLSRALQVLQSIPVHTRIEMSVKAADIFQNGTLPCGNATQAPEDYLRVLTRTSGLPIALAKANTERICAALRDTAAIMNGLARDLPFEILDKGVGKQQGVNVRFVPRIKTLGACMPNNSPGVHVIWLISLAFGIPVLIRPGSSEPFTPYRLIQAFMRAGFPAEVFGYYPCDHDSANRIPELTRGAIVFGSDQTVKRWANYPLVQVHGSGFSKLIVGDDLIEDWRSLIPQLAENVSANSGRSCFAVSRIMVPKYGSAIANALAQELESLQPGPLEDRGTMLSAMADPKQAALVNASIQSGLGQGGATDMSAPYRKNARLATFEGRTYLLPTIVHCESNGHPLAKQEFLFPYAAVVECSNETAFAEMGPTLALAVYTRDEKLIERARKTRVSLVSINRPTSSLDRRQPHEENLFDLLWERLSYTGN